MLEPLNYERIPIERSWDMSMYLHQELGHHVPWELCTECEVHVSKIIRLLFGMS